MLYVCACVCMSVCIYTYIYISDYIYISELDQEKTGSIICEAQCKMNMQSVMFKNSEFQDGKRRALYPSESEFGCLCDCTVQMPQSQPYLIIPFLQSLDKNFVCLQLQYI